MPVKTINGDAGLWLDSSTVDAPANALRLATNVMLNRSGVIRPRFGWRSHVVVAASAYRPYALFPYANGDSDTIAISYNGSAYEMRAVADAVVYNTASLTVVPPGIADSVETKSAQARGSFYLTTTKGVLKLADVSSSILERAGVFTDYVMPRIYSAARPVSTDTRYAIGTTKSAAYRYLWVRSDNNAYERRSPASERVIVDNIGATYPVIITFDRIRLPLGVVAGDRIEVYRTLGVSNGGVQYAGAPTEEYYLAVVYTVSAADVSATYVEVNKIIDSTPDDQLGETLYVSPSQGGETQNSKEPPPLARDIALWQDVLWAGHITDRPVVSIEFVHARCKGTAGTQDRSRDHVGWGFLATACNFTSGSAVVGVDLGTPYTSRLVTGNRTGQYIYDSAHPETAGTRVPASTTITAIRTKITIDNTKLNAVGTDSIKLGDVTFTWNGGAGANEVTEGATSTISATNLAAKINAYPWMTTLASTTDGNADWSLAATSSGAVVTITDANGYGVHGADITLGDAGNVDGMIPSYEYTMSANALANGSIIGTTWTDWLTINSIKFYASLSNIYSFLNDSALFASSRGLNSQGGYDSSTTITNRRACMLNAKAAADGVNAYQVSELASDRGLGVAAISSDTSLLLIGATPDQGTITVQCTVKPDAFRPRLADNLTSALRVHPGRVAWSLPSEPEAFTPLSYVDIGNPQKSVDRIIPLRDAMLVWKRDGLYRITGAPPDQWRVDPIDTTIRLVHPECVCVIENTCFAWTDRGVMSVTEAGLGDVVSMPIQSALRDMQVLLEADTTQTHRGFFMSAHPRLRLITLDVATAAVTGRSVSDAQYVLHMSTGVWAKWSRTRRAATWSPDLGRAIESSGLAEFRTLQESREVDDDDQTAIEGYSDWKQSSITLNETTGSYISTVLVSAVTPRSFEVGDAIVFNDGYGRVTEATSNGTTWTLTTTRIGAATGSLSVSWHKAVDAQVQWHAQSLGSPGVGAHWQEATLQLESTKSLLSTWPFDFGAGSHIQARDAIETVSPSITASSSTNVYSKPVRVGLPRNVSRSPTLYPYLRIRNALTNWSLSALSLIARATGTRVAR